MCKAKRYRYEHLDLDDLERILAETQDCRRRLVVTDGVFSMDGDIAPLCKSQLGRTESVLSDSKILIEHILY